MARQVMQHEGKHLEFQYGEETFCVTVEKSRRKSLAISVAGDGSVKVKAPQSLSDAELLKWIKTKTAWIVRKRNEMLESSVHQETRQYLSGEKFFFLGEEYCLEIRISESRAGTVGIAEDKLVVFVKETDAELADGDAGEKNKYQQLMKAYFTAWYEKQAHIQIPKRVRYYANIVGESYERIFIKNQKSRWGSCSSARNLNFNWRLMMAPITVLDYVVVHELCHLKQMNHSKEFWAEVENVLPDYKERKKWLDENGRLLQI